MSRILVFLPDREMKLQRNSKIIPKHHEIKTLQKFHAAKISCFKVVLNKHQY